MSVVFRIYPDVQPTDLDSFFGDETTFKALFLPVDPPDHLQDLLDLLDIFKLRLVCHDRCSLIPQLYLTRRLLMAPTSRRKLRGDTFGQGQVRALRKNLAKFLEGRFGFMVDFVGRMNELLDRLFQRFEIDLLGDIL